jgi:hypothetical protein
MNPNDVPRAEAHLRGLETLGFDVKPLWTFLADLVAARERRVPTASDLSWPLLTPCSLDEHLAGDERPLLSCGIVKGRSYALSVAQRSILREWYNMIPTPVVQVIDLAVFPQDVAPVAIIREVVLRTEEHTDPRNRAVLNGPRKIVIDRWGDFISACRTREIEIEQSRQSRSFLARSEKLFTRAKERGVRHYLSSPGSLATVWESECEAQGLTVHLTGDAEKVRQNAVREVLRSVLTSRGESALVALVREPSFFDGDGTTKLEREMSGFEAELDAMLKKSA